MNGSDGMQNGTGSFFGKYRGIVVRNDDPTRRGRLQVKVPAVMGGAPVWAMPCVPYAGEDVGFFAMPKVGAGVWVEFEAGDSSYPIWVGCYWGDGQIAESDAQPHIKFLKTDQFSVKIDDQAISLEITDGNGTTITVTATEISLEATEITQQVGTKKISLKPVGMNVNEGALEVV